MTEPPGSASNDNSPPPRDRLWTQLGHAVTMAAKQDQIVWVIFGVFWAANAALVAAVFSDTSRVALGIVRISAVGALIAYCWMRIQCRAIDWLEYYESILYHLEEHLEVPADLSLSAWRNQATFRQWVERRGGVSARHLMRASGAVMFLFWLGTCVVYLRT